MRNLRSSILLILATTLIVTDAIAQVDGAVFRISPDITVYDVNGTSQKRLPWTGGMNRPQFNMADLNNDGKDDLVIFEDGYGVKTFLSNGTGTYLYTPEYELHFPAGLIGYLKLIDYNGDNVPDLMHRGGPGVSIYKGRYANNQLSFSFFKDLYYYSPLSGTINVYVTPNDIPIIEDIDHDGDIDILAYDVPGSRIIFNKNCSIENGLPLDSFKICVPDMCWGKTQQFYERKQFLNQNCDQTFTTCKGCPPPPTPANKTTHSGNTLCAIDMDGDGDYDYFNGNISFSDIQYFKNGRIETGALIDTAISEDTIWASNGHAMFMPAFPAAYWLDINQDGYKDLLFTPQAPETENYKCVSYYKNSGSNTNPNYTYQTNTHLIDQMIDIGTGSYPVFYDYDKDGKEDLFIGSDGYYQTNGTLISRISYYRNTSTGSTPSFTLQTNDFLNLSSLNLVGAAPAFGDIDNDGIDDMVIGQTDGKIIFMSNKAAYDTIQPDWQYAQYVITSNLQPIDAGDYAAPCIYDIDNDGQNDLIVGNQLGDLIYYKNNGSAASVAIVNKITDNLGGIKIKEEFQIYGYSTPYIGSMDNTGIKYLMIGTLKGNVHRYTGFLNGNVTVPYTRVDSNYSLINIGQRAAPAFSNINNGSTNFHFMVLGNYLGGVKMYKQNFPVNIPNTTSGDIDVKVYPNPAKDFVYITWGNDFASQQVDVKFVSVTGQTITAQSYSADNTSVQLSIGDVATGVYYCVIQSGQHKVVKPISIFR